MIEPVVRDLLHAFVVLRVEDALAHRALGLLLVQQHVLLLEVKSSHLPQLLLVLPLPHLLHYVSSLLLDSLQFLQLSVQIELLFRLKNFGSCISFFLQNALVKPPVACSLFAGFGWFLVHGCLEITSEIIVASLD